MLLPRSDAARDNARDMNSPDAIPTHSFGQRLSGYLQEHPRLRRELYLLGGSFLVGFIVLPLLIYLAGMLTLGPYASGGLGAFFADFFGGLFRGWAPAWGVALGPYALVLFVRAIRFILRRFLAPADPA
jgi:hypothetical protein